MDLRKNLNKNVFIYFASSQTSGSAEAYLANPD